MKRFQFDSGTDSANRLYWLCAFRLVLTTCVFALSPFFFREIQLPFYLVVAVIYCSSIVFIPMVKLAGNHTLQGYLQITSDVILHMCIVYFSGGIISIYVYLPVITVIVASMVIFLRGALYAAILTSTLYSSMILFQRYAILPSSAQTMAVLQDDLYVSYVVYLRTLIIILVGYLGGTLANRLASQSMELRRLKNFHEAVVSNIKNGILVADVTGKIVFANNGARNILCGCSGEVVGTTWREVFLGGGSIDVGRFSRAVENEGEMEVQFDSWQERGRTCYVGVNIYDLTDANGQKYGTIFLVQDLTEKKLLEKRLREQERLTVMGRLAADIAHEIKNPLASIRGAVEILKERGAVKGEADNLFSVVIRESDRLTAVIDEFLRYGRVKASIPSRGFLTTVADEVITLMEYKKEIKAGIELVRDYAPQDGYILADFQKMTQVFYNVILNAIESMPNGGCVLVSIQTDKMGKTVLLDVEDGGAGIDQSEIEQIFSTEYTSKHRGRGIGLAIVRSIVEEHEGTIAIKSCKGEGTRVRIILPMAEEKDRISYLGKRTRKQKKKTK